MIEDFRTYEDVETGQDFLILGAGASVGHYNDNINDIVALMELKVIGINNITSICVPDYHLWTNTGRLKTFGDCILPESKLIIKKDMSPEVLQMHKITDYISLNYRDDEDIDVGYNERKGRVEGHFRTAGCLAIYLAYLMGGREIYIAGMDGYTYFNPSDLSSGKSQHHYGKGLTDHGDDRSPDEYWKAAQKKDELVAKALDDIHDAGVDFSIITPTVFESYYDPDVIGE